MKFDSLEDAKQKLKGCLFRLNKDIVYLEELSHGTNEYIAVTRKVDNAYKKLVNLSEIDFSPLPLGNSLYYNNTVFVYRQPMRQWKLGIYSNNVCAMSLGGWTNIKIYDRSFLPMFNSNYPSIGKAIDMAKQGVASHVPFSRLFSIHVTDKILYKSEHVIGTWKKDRYELKDNFFYLKEVLDEALQ